MSVALAVAGTPFVAALVAAALMSEVDEREWERERERDVGMEV